MSDTRWMIAAAVLGAAVLVVLIAIAVADGRERLRRTLAAAAADTLEAAVCRGGEQLDDFARAVLGDVPAIARHYETEHWAGPGDCGVECACGVTFAGFDSIAEAVDQLDLHIADETADLDLDLAARAMAAADEAAAVPR